MTKTTSSQFINTIIYKVDHNSLNRVRKQNQKLQQQMSRATRGSQGNAKRFLTAEQRLIAQKNKDIKAMNKLHESAFKMNIRRDNKIARDKTRYDYMKENRINNYLLGLKKVNAAEKISIRNELRQIKNIDQMNRRMKQLKIQAGQVKIGGTSGLSTGGEAIQMGYGGGYGRGSAAMVGSMIGAGITALGAGTLGLVHSNGEQYRELANQAKQAEMTVKQYQIVSAGARKEGITQEKLGDQLKDVGEKWGEYFKIVKGSYDAKGTGTEAVEILQKAGHSLKAISKMKPDIVMQKLAKAFTTLNIGEAQRKLIMEDLADESSRTIKAYITGFDGVNKQLEKYNWLISDSDITKYIEAASQVDTMSSGFKKLQSEFALAFVGDQGLQSLTDNWLATLQNIEQPVEELGKTLRSALDFTLDPAVSPFDKVLIGAKTYLSMLQEIVTTVHSIALTPLNKGLAHVKNSYDLDKPTTFNPKLGSYGDDKSKKGYGNWGTPYQISTSSSYTQHIKNEIKVKVEMNTDLFTSSVENIANNALQDTYSDAASTMSPDS